jgi:hypothetical protein
LASRTSSHEATDAGERPSARSRLLAAFLSLAVAAAVGAAAARAGSCRVLVALGSVDIEPSPAGMSVRIGGSWEFDNLVQVVSGLSYNLLIVRDDKFVRMTFPEGAWSGSVAGLGARLDAGIDGSDILSVEAAGFTEPAARFVSVEAQRLKATSPVPPGTGPISFVAYLVLDGDYMSPIISNVLTRPLNLATATPNDDGTATAPSIDAVAQSADESAPKTAVEAAP